MRPIPSTATRPCRPQGSFAPSQGKAPCARSSRRCSCNLPSTRSRSTTSRSRSSIRFRPSVALSTPRSGIHNVPRPQWPVLNCPSAWLPVSDQRQVCALLRFHATNAPLPILDRGRPRSRSELQSQSHAYRTFTCRCTVQAVRSGSRVGPLRALSPVRV